MERFVSAITSDITNRQLRIAIDKLILKLVFFCIIFLGICIRLNNDRVIHVIAERDFSTLVSPAVAVLHKVQIIQLSGKPIELLYQL